jgi:hypothetical protein
MAPNHQPSLTQFVDRRFPLPLSPSQKSKLSKKAANGTMEVEHLIFAAKHGDPSDCPFLTELSQQYHWPEITSSPESPHYPLGTWVTVICCFMKEGHAGLLKHCRENARHTDLAIGLLEEVKSSESVSTLLAIGNGVVTHPESDRRRATRLAEAFNLILSFKHAPDIGDAQESTIRSFLHCYTLSATSESEISTGLCALRGVGDDSSLKLISRLPELNEPWKGLFLSVRKQIRKRLHRED